LDPAKDHLPALPPKLIAQTVGTGSVSGHATDPHQVARRVEVDVLHFLLDDLHLVPGRGQPFEDVRAWSKNDERSRVFNARPRLGETRTIFIRHPSIASSGHAAE